MSSQKTRRSHNRLAICQEHGIDYEIFEKSFPSRLAAKIWIVKNQLGRRNISVYDRGKLILVLEPMIAEEAKERQRTSTGGAHPQLVQNSAQAGEVGKTRDELARQAGISHDTIAKVKRPMPSLVSSMRFPRACPSSSMR